MAASMPDQVDEETSRRRIHELIAVQERITGEIYAGQAGRIERVLVEGPAARGEGKLAGRTERGITVNFTGTASEGELVDVKIPGAGHNTLKGEQVGS